MYEPTTVNNKAQHTDNVKLSKPSLEKATLTISIQKEWII